MNHSLGRWLVPAGCAALVGAAQLGWAGSPAATSTATSKPPAAAAAASEDRKTIYEMGVLLSRGLDTFQLSEAEFEAMKAGMSDGFHQRVSTAEANAYMPKVQELQRARVSVAAQHEKETGQAYLAKASQTPGAQRLPGGMLYLPLAQGTGASPSGTDEIKVNYEGRLIDGTVFDSSGKHGAQPVSLTVSGVIPCWTEALKVMKVGGKSRIICPSDLAYGDRGALPMIKPGATLEFDVELVDIQAHAAAPSATPSVGSEQGTSLAP